MGDVVRVQGLRDVQRLTRDLGAAAKETRKRLRDDVLKPVAEPAVAEARRLAPDVTGLLVGSIKPRVTARMVAITATAQRRGFNYPTRIEFQNAGRQAFLRPARDRALDETERRAEQMIDGLAHAFEGGHL